MKERSILVICFLLCFGFGFAQDKIEISGTVFSSKDNQPIMGASVIVTNNPIVGTTTDFNGKFILTISEDAENLTFSYLGMEEKILPPQDGMEVYLEPDLNTLNEVLVVAYGTTKRSAFTGSATSVDGADLITPAASFDKGLDGKVAGVQVISSSGQPGSATSFRIRGSGSLKASNEPLFVIDGVPINSITDYEYSEVAADNSSSGNILSSINPNDIESVTVLKDAAAAALYGSRAANGVVIITTKSGKKGGVKVNLNTRVSWASLPKAYSMVSSDQYYKQLFNAYLKTGESVEDANLKAQGAITHNPYNVDFPLDASGNPISGAQIVVNTNWQDEVFKTALSQDYDLNVSGGNERSNYYFSVGYSDMEGIAPASNFERYSGKIKVNTEATDWLELGMNMSYSNYVQETTVAGSAGASPLYNALTFPNGVPVYRVDSNGNPILDDQGNRQFNFTNPVNLDFNPLAIPYMDTHSSEFYRALPSAFALVKFTDDLNFRTVISADYLSSNEDRYWNKEHGNGPAYNGRLDKYHHTNFSYTSTNTLNYNLGISEIHNLDFLAGMEYWKSTFKTLYAGGRDLLGEMKELAAAGGSFSPHSDKLQETLISYFGRLEYSFDDKLNLSGSLRSDGSSIFGSENKWGTFWSVGASWQLNKERFLENSELIKDLKLRLSYGTSGNKSGLGRYASLGLWTADSEYLYGSNIGVGHEQLENALLQWEKQAMFNVGVDFGIFGRKINGSIDYFSKTSDGLLYDYPLALSNGFEEITLNAAKTTNSGFELDLGANVLDGDFSWKVNFNASFIKDKIKDLHGDDDVQVSANRKIWSIGGSQYEFFMPTWAGVDKDTGDPLWYVVNDNGGRTTTNNYNEATYEKQGRSTPDVFGSLGNVFSYKNFDLAVQLNYTLGGKFYDGLYNRLMHDGNSLGTNLHVDALNSWKTAGDLTDVPEFIPNNSSGSSSLSSRFLYNPTNVKIRNITLSYNLPHNLGLYSKYIESTRLWVSVDNLYTWFSDSNYKGYEDIDIYGVQGYRQYPAIPVPRTFSIGASLTF